MAILNNNPLVGASGNQGGYNINNSLRFRSSASAFLNRTPASAGSRTTWTWSGWVKRGSLGTHQTIFSSNTSSVPNLNDYITVDTNNILTYYSVLQGTSVNIQLSTTQVFRDPSAWYHIILAVDTAQATASNRVKIYVNGSQVTAFSTATYPSLNYVTGMNATVIHNIGNRSGTSEYFDGYLAETNFIDGQALTPSSFGETDTTTGVWKPKAYSGTYGTNGFYLKFSDIATTSGSNAGLGRDFSGNGNFWTTNNISVTSGVTYDAMTDSPTLTSATVANYATLNPVDNPSSSNSLANANLTASTAGASGWRGIRATMAFPTTGKWYYEVTLTSGTNNLFLGIVSSAATGVYHDHADTFAVRMSDCALRPGGATATGTQAGYAVGDIFGVAIDCSTPTVQFYKNGSLNVTYTSPTFDPSKTYFPCFLGNDTGASATHNFNFGQRPFAYTPPTGFVALNTFNLPTPTILQGNKYMDATLYTGNGSTQTITNAGGFYPDLIWIKSRSNATNNNLFTSVLSGSNILKSNSTDGVVGVTNAVTTFNSNGFTLGSDSGSIGVNINSNTYVAWQWLAGATSGTTSNTNGSITSFINVNTTAGFSQVYWTGTAANGTLGHGLGVAPRMIITKCRGASTDWAVYHASIGNTGALRLNLTAATETDSRYWNNTSPTSTVWSVGSSNASNAATAMVAYCWAQIPGFSAFGSYVGNGSSPGPFVYLGFRPEFIMAKSTSINRNWIMFDATRSPFNTASARLFANTSGAESTNEQVLFLSNGFQMTTNTFDGNTNGETYIYMAFAENPFKNALAR